MDISEYERYGRQMIVPEMGLAGQETLKNSKVLVVGAGGLGCPAIAYLGGAGVGTLGIVDPDCVEVSNLHRQILHNELGKPKAESAAEYVAKLNPNVKLRTWLEPLTNANAMKILSEFDVVLDCTDTPMSRYLINDACVLANKPLVSASALKTEGQLAVYHYGSKGPCYRCLFPHPPPPQLIGTCGDNGILGPVVGLMGVSQAVEALKVLLGAEILPNLSIYSMFSFPQWRQMKIRFRQPNCSVCGDNPTITDLLEIDYQQFCGSVPQSATEYRITAAEFAKQSTPIVDVRSAAQFAVVSLPNSVSLPLSQLRKMDGTEIALRFKEGVRVVCHHGLDSQEAVEILRGCGVDAHDLAGGLTAWSKFDPDFPVY